MKRSATVIAVSFWFMLAGCSSSEKIEEVEEEVAPPIVQEKWPFPRSLYGTDACFLLFDLNRDQVMEAVGEPHCREQLPACSTFKIPLAVMAFDSGVLAGEKTKIRWNGKKAAFPSWGRDQTASTWLRESVVWVSQWLTQKLGRKRVQKYLEDFRYGNRDFTGGLQDAWLTTAPHLKETPKTSVRISAYEQIDFLKLLYRDQLRASKEAMSLARRSLPSEKSPQGSVLTGKTGSGFIGDHAELRLGWYAAHLRKGDRQYLAVVTFTDRTPIRRPGFGGTLAKNAMKAMLAERGLW
jgi:beta-lactamase class D